MDVRSSHALHKPRDEWVMPSNDGKVQLPVGHVKGRTSVDAVLGVVRPALTAFKAAGGIVTGPILGPVPTSESGSLAATGMRACSPESRMRLHKFVLMACCAKGPIASRRMVVRAATKGTIL